MKRFDIRIESPQGVKSDLQFLADSIEHAKIQAEAMLRRTQEVKFLQWRGAVAFLNRSVPLSETPLRVMR